MLLLTQKEFKTLINIIVFKPTNQTFKALLRDADQQKPGTKKLINRLLSDEEVKII